MLGVTYFAFIAAWMIAPVETNALTYVAAIAVCIIIGGYIGGLVRAN